MSDRLQVFLSEAIFSAAKQGPMYQAQAILDALTKTGYAIVPVEPTEAMMEASVRSDAFPTGGKEKHARNYRAMIKASVKGTDNAS